MDWKFLSLLCLALLVIAVIGLVPVLRSRRRHTTQVVCIDCRGRGISVDQTRTLDFDGTGFVDEDPRSRTCPACGGTGKVSRSI